MMVEIKLGGTPGMELTVSENQLILANMVNPETKKPIRNLTILEFKDSPFDLTEDEFKTIRKKLLAGKPNTVLEINTLKTRPWIRDLMKGGAQA